ncbi:MAG: prepilin-type N-terminal cleavage/methylation domain-containing protein [Nitrospira sp.]|jgi:prepilin-type N-terminal cleavage/methylation domain-containing protein
MIQRIREDTGFTLIEVMMVLAILSILAALAMISHRHFVEKARSVEAEVALAEIDRLETLYYANHGTYSGDLNAIGFSLSSTLRYYKVTVRLEKGGASFQASAISLSGEKTQPALVLTHSKDGTFLQRTDPVKLAGPSGGATESGGALSADQGTGGAGAGAGSNSAKANCRQGGEATVAADGLLDMNFCFK